MSQLNMGGSPIKVRCKASAKLVAICMAVIKLGYVFSISVGDNVFPRVFTVKKPCIEKQAYTIRVWVYCGCMAQIALITYLGCKLVLGAAKTHVAKARITHAHMLRSLDIY